MRRVVVTGLGVISPVGNDIDTFWKNIVAGVNGIDLITKFDVTNFSVKIAGQVKDFDPTKYMDPKAARHSALFCQYRCYGKRSQADGDEQYESCQSVQHSRDDFEHGRRYDWH